MINNNPCIMLKGESLIKNMKMNVIIGINIGIRLNLWYIKKISMGYHSFRDKIGRED
jgi:hypothetical protein